MGSQKTVMLEGGDKFLRLERVAAAAITPGHLVELTSADKVQKHSTAAGFTAKMFAVEDELQGKTIDQEYASASRVQFNVCPPGCIVNALIADGEDIAIGDKLVSNGDGTLKEADSAATDEIVGVAMEAVDMSDSSAADPSPRCAVLIA